MRYSNFRMPVVYVLATDWRLRTAVRAELRERGIDALGMDSAEEAGRALARGEMPAVVVLEANSELVGDSARHHLGDGDLGGPVRVVDLGGGLGGLVERVPTVLVASRTETVSLPTAAAVLYRPVSVGEIVAKVLELLERGQVA